MKSIIGKLIGEGGSAMVFTATPDYTKYVHRHSMYNDPLAVRVSRFFEEDWTKEIKMNQHLNFYEIAHAAPLLHWMAEDQYGQSVDGFYDSVETNLNGYITLYMTYPLMKSVMEDCRSFTEQQQKDASLQLIYMIQSLHDNGIYHGDFYLKNILYRKEGEYVHLYLTDFGESKYLSECDEREIRRDYRGLVQNIVFIFFGVAFHKLRDYASTDAYELLDTIWGLHSSEMDPYLEKLKILIMDE